MKHFFDWLGPRSFTLFFSSLVLLLAFFLFLMKPVAAGPGAHGPDGQHLDAPQNTGLKSSAPRMEATSELFELVATLRAGELSILIDQFATNEPVLNATVEVQLGPLKAKASFHTDHGDYAVDDPAMLKALSTSGPHALVFTIINGNDGDLLEGTIVTASDAHTNAKSIGPVLRTWLPIAIAVVVAGVAAFWAWRATQRRRWAARGGRP
jgi:hypothetical protein